MLNAVDSRLKKIDLLKQELLPGLEGMQHLLLSSCGQNDLQTFVEGRNTNTYKKKQIIYSESNHPNRLYYVVKGKVKTYKTNEDGKAFVTGLFSAGDFLGYTALLEDAVYRDTAEALEETELAVIPLSRSFTLPEDINKEKIDARYEDGVLKLSLPKKEEKKMAPSKHISVK